MDINETFRTVSRILFQSEIGDANEFDGLLSRYVEPLRKTNSIVSGKEVYYAEPYKREAKFLSMEEVGEYKIEPMKSYEFKDIDGLLDAIEERFFYVGNKIFGTSQDINEGESCGNSFHIYKSHHVFNSENIGYSQMINNSKYLIGCVLGNESNFCMNSIGGLKINRCFESALLSNSSDVYYSFNCKNCLEVMFCFNQFSKRYAIGNTILEKDKYLEIKKKLLGEIVEELKKKKTIPSLFEMASGGFGNE